MKRFYFILIVGVLVSSGMGCSASSWFNKDGNVVTDPPTRLDRSAGRASGVSSQARAIERRLNYH